MTPIQIQNTLELLESLQVAQRLLPAQDVEEIDEIVLAIAQLRASEEDLRKAVEFIRKAEPIAAAEAASTEESYQTQLDEVKTMKKNLEDLKQKSEEEGKNLSEKLAEITHKAYRKS